MTTPIQRLIEELKVDMRKSETVLKRSGLTEHQKSIYNAQRTTLFNVLFNLETNYLNIEIDYLNKLKR